MSKKCLNCGNVLEDSVRFCSVCGSSEFQNLAQNGNMQPDFVQMQNVYSPPTQKKGGLKGWQMALIISAIILFAVMVSGVLAAIWSAEDENTGYQGSSYSNTGSESGAKSDVDYTKGSFDGVTYTNEWADIKFQLPEGFTDADSTVYSAAENANTDCGLYVISNDTMSLMYVAFEKLPVFSNYNEEKYLDACMENLKKQAQPKYETTDQYTTKNVAGYTYTVAECSFSNANGEFAQSIYVRKLDDKIIFVSAAGVSHEKNDALIATIERAR